MKTPNEHNLIFLLHEVAHLMRTAADQRARERGMTRAQWVILKRLFRTPGLSQNELAAIIEVEPITIGRLIDRLEARGLVERRRDPKDRRIHRLHLKPKAAPIIREIDQCLAELEMIMVDGVERRTLDATSAALTRIKANLTARAEAHGKPSR
ncbi:MAG TPA: MarR family transcriptional regulator [Xanthobacteraceae bacterium]|nr:MarR family transcriptional regulator [Xanthobacteraceae bacterium]